MTISRNKALVIKDIAMKKANQPKHCDFNVSAIGVNKKGDIIGRSVNKSRFLRKGGGIHAEMRLMLKLGQGLKSIIICRTGKGGELRPIDPCDTCKKKADELGIKIYSIQDLL